MFSITVPRCRQFRRDESGVALLEFAIFVSLLLVLIFGIIDFGRALFTANNLTAAAREGARYGSALTNPCGNRMAIKQRAASNMSPFGGAVVKPDYVVVVFPQTDCVGGPPEAVQVQINYPFTWLTPLPALLRQPLTPTLHAQATFRWEGA